MKLILTNLNKKLSHLKENEIKKLIEEYKAGIKNKQLILKYKINIYYSGLHNTFPLYESEDKCIYCSINMLQKIPSRSGYSRNSTFCPKCKHIDHGNCNCEGCINKLHKMEKEKTESKQDLINTFYPGNQQKIEYHTLNITTKLYLSALIYAGLSENYNYTIPLSDLLIPLSPSLEYDKKILNYLIEKRVINASPLSDSSAFNFDYENYYINGFYSHKVKYDVNIGKEDIKKLLFPKNEINNYSINTLFLIYKELGLEECKQDLINNFNKISFPYKIGNKTEDILKFMLEHFSIAQVHNMIWTKSTHALRYYETHDISRRQAANSIVKGLQNYTDTAINENYSIKTSYRTSPISGLSYCLSNKYLKEGEKLFNNYYSLKDFMDLNKN